MFKWLVPDRDEGIFRNIPLPTKGALYTSPMPFGAYDPGNRLLNIYRKKHIDHVFMLVTEKELEKKARRNVRKIYTKYDIGFSQYPIMDFTAPPLETIHSLVKEALERLQSQSIVVHCHAGVGRTAIVVCAIIMAVKKVPAKVAIDEAKKSMTVTITDEQKRVIEKLERE